MYLVICYLVSSILVELVSLQYTNAKALFPFPKKKKKERMNERKKERKIQHLAPSVIQRLYFNSQIGVNVICSNSIVWLLRPCYYYYLKHHKIYLRGVVGKVQNVTYSEEIPSM